VATNRSFTGEDGKRVNLTVGALVGCSLCHENPMTEHDN
jgi:hypothetical protein